MTGHRDRLPAFDLDLDDDGEDLGIPVPAHRLLIVGQAPARGRDGDPAWLRTASGNRLARMMGLPPEHLLDVVDGVNILPRRPPTGPGGITTLDRTTLLLARHVLWHHPHRHIIACGTAAAAALVDAPPPPLLTWQRTRFRDGSRRMLAVFPHPSGASRYWNDPARARTAAAWLAVQTREEVRQWRARPASRAAAS